ncbi:RagB/SusD family nutrient uptake outer membrane protein [Desertivirga brevis]|uniref:RagB/SusD family nutrient uptake outer membrane protein n=1 Tax=Desertivirga brevis TaxID=2810310 RepID=UPI001A95F865|nr:RagB/SusD family nutrient uptake outer membrane protein [Pedobacter sp. SYSU D00873]
MNNIKSILRLAVLAFSITAIFSCKKDFLENESKTNLDDLSLWQTENNADIFLNDMYGNLFRINNTPDQLDNYTDDNDAGPYWPWWGWRSGSVTPTSNAMNYNAFDWNSDTYANWQRAYERIRKANLFIQKLNENKANFSEEWYQKRIDEARFLRAFTYSYLLKHFGGVPIITNTQSRQTDSEEEINRPRATFAETVDFITGQLDSIVTNNKLAVKHTRDQQDAGRATLGAALALKGWIELFAASPAFNTSTPAAAQGTGASDAQKKLVGYGDYDIQRWVRAAATNRKFIETYEGTYDLFPDLSTFWTEQNEYNKEVIFDRQHVTATTNNLGNNLEVYGGPTFVLGQYRSWGNYCPTQELVDQFGMANGKGINEAGSGYNPQNPYVNRDKRFYDFIVYDGAPYKMNWMPTTDIIYTRIDKVNPSPNEIDFATADPTNTGYYFKKRLNPDANPGTWWISGLNYVFFRYAEVLLNYAEAQNEAINHPDASIYAAINKIRRRSNVPTLEETYGGQVLTKEQMREVIRRERRVELCFENKRFYDIIRWKIAEDVLNKDLHGMKITNTSPNDNSGVWKYEKVGLNHPHVFQNKMYLLPIPQSAIDRNNNLIQNPGY